MPSHTHTQIYYVFNAKSGRRGPGDNTATTTTASGAATASAGSSGSHNHTFTGTAIDLAVQYVDVIIATKD